MGMTRRPGSFYAIGDGFDEVAGIAGGLPSLQLTAQPTPGGAGTDPATQPSLTPTDGGAADVHDVVFIDSRVPDLPDLLNGLNPSEQAFVIDGGSDGLEQIADTLAANHLTNLSSVSIVSHGTTGELVLGSSLITDGNLADHSGALATIGASLAQDGAIELFSCDAAQGPAGRQFIDDFSALAGGAMVEASTHVVGSAALGGSWTLDASSNNTQPPAAPDHHTASDSSTAAPTEPFTNAALADFQSALVAAPTGQLFFRINQGNDVQLGAINNTGASATPTTVYFGGGFTGGPPPQNIGLHNGNEQSVAVDTAAGLVFSVGVGKSTDTTAPINNSFDAISVFNHNTGQLIETIEFGPNTGDANTDDIVQALTLDPFTHTLYVGDWGTDTAHTGVARFTYNPLTGILTPSTSGTGSTQITTTQPNGSSVLSTASGIYQFTSSQLTTPAAFTDAQAFFLDSANHKLYYTNDDAGYNISPFSPTNAVYVIDTQTLVTTQLTSLTQFPTANQSLSGHDQFLGPNGSLLGMAVDVAHGVVFFETTDDAAHSQNIGLWWVNTTGANQTATKITLPAGVNLNFPGQINAGGDAAGLTFDATTQQLWLTNAQNDNTIPDLGAIYQLQWNAATHSVTLINKYDTAQLTGTTPANANSFDAPSTTFLDVLPTIASVTGTSNSATEQSANVTLLTAAPTITDPDGDHLASATVQITGGTFSPASGDTSANDDHLTVNGQSSGLVAGTNITVSYDTASETLTLSGYDTFANYQTVLSHVQYNTTGDNPTNYGANTSRTITWQVNDGAVGDPVGATNTATTNLTVVGVDDAPVNNTGSVSATGNEDSTFSITGLTITDVDADPANQNIQVTLSVSHGTLTLNTGVAGGITAGEITAGASGSSTFTVTATQNQINATLGNATGLQYHGNANFNTGFAAENLHIVTSDLGNTGSGGPLTDTDDVAVTVN